MFTSVLRIPANEGAKLTIRELDQISTTVPIVVFRGRFGTALLNSAALRKAGITRETAFFAGVPVPKDQNGDLTGVNPPSGLTPASQDAGAAVLEKVLPPMTEEDEERFLLEAIRQRHSLGLTSVRDLNLTPEAIRAYMRLWRKERLTLRLSMGVGVIHAEQLEDTLRHWGVQPGFGDTWLRFDSISESPRRPKLMREPLPRRP